VSTLNEIAANHARMAKAKAEESIAPGERQLQIVGSFELPTADAQPPIPLHLIAGAQDIPLGQATGYAL